MKLVLLSDLHITEGEPLHDRQPRACLRRAIDHITAHHGDAELCLLLGDLAHSGSPGQYRALDDALAGLPLPHRLLLGNHDDRQNFLQVFGAAQADSLGAVQGVVDLGGYRCVLLDSHLPGESGGSLDGGRLDWLASVLAAADRPCLLFLHHPPLKTGLPAFDAIGLRERAAFAAIVAAERHKVAAIFFGHCHMALAGTVAGVPAFGVRSTVYQALPNLADTRFLDAPALPPAYGVVLADAAGIVLHHVEFGYDGPVVVSAVEADAPS